MDSYRQFTIEEREMIFLLNEQNFSTREIARNLGRNPSTISSALSRNSQNAKYTPHNAQNQYVEEK